MINTVYKGKNALHIMQSLYRFSVILSLLLSGLLIVFTKIRMFAALM